MSETPIAGRLRRPGWKDPRLLVGIALVLMSVVAVSGLLRGADRTTPYYAAKSTLVPGQILSKDDVFVTRARLDQGNYIAADSSPWGQVVTRVIGKGELLPASSLADAAQQRTRSVAVQTTLPLSAAIDRGSVVDVYVTDTQVDAPRTEVVASALVVESVDRESGSFGSGQGETVYVLVPQDQIESFLTALASDGEISVVGPGGDS